MTVNNGSIIGIVILNYKNWQVTAKSINSINSIKKNSEIEIIVIDNGSNNNSEKHIRDNIAFPVKFINLPNNIGFAKANNVGVDWCAKQGIRYCLLSNSDILFSDYCIDNIKKVFEQNDDAIIVGPRIIKPDGDLQFSSLLKPTRFLDSIYSFSLFKPKRANENLDNITVPVCSVSGCCFMVDVQKFIKIGKFDDHTFLYNEENILAARVKRSKYQTYFTSTSYVIHQHAASSGVKNDFVYSELLKSTLYYWKCYRSLSKFQLNVLIKLYEIKLVLINLKDHKHTLNVSKIIENGKNYLYKL